jgi:hypothetical protein
MPGGAADTGGASGTGGAGGASPSFSPATAVPAAPNKSQKANGATGERKQRRMENVPPASCRLCAGTPVAQTSLPAAMTFLERMFFVLMWRRRPARITGSGTRKSPIV